MARSRDEFGLGWGKGCSWDPVGGGQGCCLPSSAQGGPDVTSAGLRAPGLDGCQVLGGLEGEGVALCTPAAPGERREGLGGPEFLFKLDRMKMI